MTLTCSGKCLAYLWGAVRTVSITACGSSSFKFLLFAAGASTQIRLCAYRYCLQAPGVPRARLLRGSEVHHPIKWPRCHSWIYHQAAVLSSWIPKGQTDTCMVNLIVFMYLALDCFLWKDGKSAITVVISFNLIGQPHYVITFLWFMPSPVRY